MNERLQRILGNPMRAPIMAGVAAFAGGMCVGFFLGRKTKQTNQTKIDIYTLPEQKELDFEDVSDELSDIKHYVDHLNEVRVKSNSVTVHEGKAGSAKVIKLKEETVASQISEPNVEEIVVNLLDDDNDNWNYDKEIKNRSSSAPYVIHKDEFYAEELGYTQTTLVYYAGDDIVVDEDESPVYNHERVIGPMMFGHGSGDPNVFHVRNDKRKAEYEICYDEGLYSVEVLGLEIENNQRAVDVKHSDKKFKLE